MGSLLQVVAKHSLKTPDFRVPQLKSDQRDLCRAYYCFTIGVLDQKLVLDVNSSNNPLCI
jgi:hypothetical protein